MRLTADEAIWVRRLSPVTSARPPSLAMATPVVLAPEPEPLDLSSEAPRSVNDTSPSSWLLYWVSKLPQTCAFATL